MNIVETSGLGKRYRRTWALDDCTLAIPSEHIVALVGPNGAGKTTLLHAIVGLISPTIGTLRVLGGLAAGSPPALDRIAFVGQDAPVHSFLTVRAMVGIAVGLNPGFDEDLALARFGELAIPLQQKVGKLSGGQRAQLALTLALARHPRLLVLDEPLARLDPLARHDFMGIVMAAVESDGLSVLFSSHVVSELERVADFMIVLSSGHLQMAGEIDDLLAQHCLLVGPAEQVEPVCAALPVIHTVVAGRRANLIVRASEAQEIPAGWEAESVSLEELVLAYLREPTAAMDPKPLALASSHQNKATR